MSGSQGVGEVQLWGSGDYSMRIWLDPQKVAQRGMTATDVVNAIREQNVQVAAGVIGGVADAAERARATERECARPLAERSASSGTSC